MHGRRRLILGVAALAGSVLLAAGAVVEAVGAEGSGDSDSGETETPITGAALTRATEAALAVTGGGTVTGTEVGDEDSHYEVEVTLPDGTEVDVQLDESFTFVETN